MAKDDLDETVNQNVIDLDHLYGNGRSIGDDMFRHTRSYTQMDGAILEKQLEGLT